MRIMLLGAPGVGKGSQATQIAKKLSIPHISTGDIFRYHIGQQTELGKKAKQYIDNGLLVPDEITMEIVSERLQQDDCKNGFVLDGFPRTTQQASFLDEILKDLESPLDVIINIILDDNSIIDRLSGRRVCLKCNATYHTSDKPPRRHNVCDHCSTSVTQRADDHEDTIVKRLLVYHKQTAPLIEYYKGKVEMINIQSNPSFEVTTRLVFSALGLQLS